MTERLQKAVEELRQYEGKIDKRASAQLTELREAFEDVLKGEMTARQMVAERCADSLDSIAYQLVVMNERTMANE